MNRSTIVLAFVVALAGCADRAGNTSGVKSGRAIGFAELREQVLAPHCLGCHGANQKPLLNTYADVKANLDKIRETVLVRRSMPKRAPLPQAEMAMVEKWIADGGPEAGPPPQKPPVTPQAERPPMTWATIKPKLLNGRCLVCHFPNNPDKITNLDDYETFKATVGTVYFLSVATPSMPPPPKGTAEGAPNPNALTREEKETLSYWVVDGMLP